VTAIVTCWNSGPLVEEALRSVRAQTRPPDELLVVDGGSTEPASLDSLARIEEGGVRLIRLSASRLAASRAAGFEASTGGLVLYLDADNRLAPTYVEVTTERLESDPGLDFVTTGMRGFGALAYSWTPPSPDPVSILTRGAPHQSSVFRRSLYERAGGFDPRFRVVVDFEFWLRAALAGGRCEVVDQPLLEYRVRRDSLYHAALESGEFWPEMRELLRKHQSVVQAAGPTLFLRLDAYAAEERARQAALLREVSEAERETRAVEEQLAATRSLLASRPPRAVDWGSLRRLTPVSPVWGLDRGGPLDRYYIAKFLDGHRHLIRGRVLEVKDSGYTRGFGGEKVVAAEVLDRDPRNSDATILADLTVAGSLPPNRFDCFILTQTLHILFDVRTAIRNAVASIRPGGTLLCTLPAVSRVNYEDGGLRSGDYWRFTEASCRALFEEWLPRDCVEITTFGNVLACTAFLQGISWRELDAAELDRVDPYYPLLFGVLARKPGG
jgi:hypothetical protein